MIRKTKFRIFVVALFGCGITFLYIVKHVERKYKVVSRHSSEIDSFTTNDSPNGDDSKRIDRVLRHIGEDSRSANQSVGLRDDEKLRHHDTPDSKDKSSLLSSLLHLADSSSFLVKISILSNKDEKAGDESNTADSNSIVAKISVIPDSNDNSRNSLNFPKPIATSSHLSINSKNNEKANRVSNIVQSADSSFALPTDGRSIIPGINKNPISSTNFSKSVATSNQQAVIAENKEIANRVSNIVQSADLSFALPNYDNRSIIPGINKDPRSSSNFLKPIVTSNHPSVISENKEIDNRVSNFVQFADSSYGVPVNDDRFTKKSNGFTSWNLESTTPYPPITMTNNDELSNTPKFENPINFARLSHKRPFSFNQQLSNILYDVRKRMDDDSLLNKPSFNWNNENALLNKPIFTWNNFKFKDTVNNFKYEHLFNKTETLLDQTCVHPLLDINDPQMSEHFYPVPPIICNTEPDWLTIENGFAYITPACKEKYGNFDCEIRYILRNDDFSLELTEPELLKSSSILHLKHDFFTCRCQVKISPEEFKTYENVHAGISMKPDVHLRSTNIGSGLGLNVLMLGFDSVSRMTYMRKLKKTYEYFTEKLGGIVLNGYNIVGDGTPQALIPIMTGKTEVELPRTLKNLIEVRYCDVFPMVWKDFQEKGYATAFGEDDPDIGTFTLRMNGFKRQPTDHYLRPFYMEASKHFYEFSPKFCLGSKRRNEVLFDWVKQFFIMYENKPKFAFGFHGELSHNHNNLVETADLDLQSTLKYLNEAGYLNNTLLILMSDHGARFSQIRATLQGKQEERRPFFGFAFPKWFENKYPEIIRNMKINSNRLSTPFDIYFTFKDLLDYNNLAENKISKRGMSLFKEIPKSRSCENAGIDTHWCACLEWRGVNTRDTNVLKAADSLLVHLNKLTQPYRQLCSELRLSAISKAFILLPKQNMLKFKKSLDEAYEVPDLSESTDMGDVKYQIWTQTSPGNGYFEATINYNTKNNEFSVNTEHISRINRYGSDANCIEKFNQDLRKFCFCGNP